MREFFFRILEDYSDLAAVICIPFIISIFAFAFPLLISSAERIDGKYNSSILIKLFRRDAWSKVFIACMVISVITIIIYALHLPRIIDCCYVFNILLDNSAVILLTLSTIALIISTIGFIWLIYKYNLPLELFDRLRSKYLHSKDKQTFNGLSQLMYYSINQADEDLAKECLTFYFSEFANFRKNKATIPIKYPEEFYNAAFEANELLCKRDKRTISYYNDGTIYEWFIDSYQSTIIGKETYSLLWRCLVRNIQFDRDDFVSAYWRKAHQHFEFFLRPVTPQYNKEFIITNNPEIEKRNQERERFLEIHYALGGLLLMQKKYTLIQELTSYSNMIPPKYVLVPETLAEVIERYVRVSKDNYSNPVYYEQKYPFPDVSGVNGDGIIRMWIKRYLAILMLQQYKLNEYYVYSRTLQTPTIPNDLSEQRTWKDSLDNLKYFVDDYLSQQEVLSELGLVELSKPDWFLENNKKHPDELIEDYKKQIVKTSEEIKENQEIDPEKEKEFKDLSASIVKKAFEAYNPLWNKAVITNNYKSIYFSGRYEPIDKMPFASQQDVSYLNADRITADCVAQEFSVNVLSLFLFMKRDRYILQEQDLFSAIKQLNIDSEIFTIVSVGLNLPYYRDFLKITELIEKQNQWTYNGIEIIQTEYIHPSLAQSLIVLKKSDLPQIEHLCIEQDIIDKYSLAEIDADNHIYASLVDLNKPQNKNVCDEVAKATNQSYLGDKVLVCVDHKTEIRYKTDAKCLQLKAYNQFEDRVTTNKIDDVKFIW